VEVDLGDTTDHYLYVYGWLPDGSELLVGRYDRLFSRVEILAADPATGTTRLVLREDADTFLATLFLFRGDSSGFWMLPDGSGFIWRSERDGWSHLYRYDLQGELVAQLTSGEFPVLEVTEIDQKRGWVYFQAHGDPVRVYDNHLYRVRMDGGGRVQQLTEGKGRHTIAMAPSCEAFLDTFSSVDTPPQTVLRRADGKLLQVLARADISRLEQIGWVPSKEYIVKAADGETDMWVTVHFPYNFDPDKKYPVFEDIYAGPQVMKRSMDFGANATVLGNWEMRNFPRALAQLGFLAISMDGRGTPGRSKAFHDAIYGNWGQFEIADHAGAITQLADQLPSVDVDRVAVSGASWGGHYTFRALTQAPEVYKFGSPEVPEYDSRAHTLIEPYIGGLPVDSRDAYDTADALLLAPKLKGRMLQVTGANDVSTQNQFFQLSEALIRLGIHHDNMIYPNAGHGWFGATARYNNTLKSNWLTTHMQP
jgi:dipeptidyl aminopeptidase/acylaminoacyl peptidase